MTARDDCPRLARLEARELQRPDPRDPVAELTWLLDEVDRLRAIVDMVGLN